MLGMSTQIGWYSNGFAGGGVGTPRVPLLC
jgi:hypothetical protein